MASVLNPKVLDFSRIDPYRDKTLRDYQAENKMKIYNAWCQCNSVMLQMPTGTGKTRLFVSIVNDIMDYSERSAKTFKVLILAHRRELIDQISDHLALKYRVPHGLIMANNREKRSYPIQVGSVPTLSKRLDRWKAQKFDVIIIDEAHHVKAKSYKTIINLYPDAKLLGVTATPYRLNHAGFRPEFDQLIVSAPVSEFIKRGYLCDYEYYSIKPDSKLQRKIDRMKLDYVGDYMQKDMMDVIDNDKIRADILETYQKLAAGKKTIVYTINRDHNVHLAKKFAQAGITSASIDSQTPRYTRDSIVNQFREGQIQVLFNVNIFSEGFDCPDVEVIQLARPTKSLSMYLQQVGRGFRPAEGKDKLIVLDNVGLYNKFGFPSARRHWQYHFEGQEVDESPYTQQVKPDEDRIVKEIVEGHEEVAMLHASIDEETTITAQEESSNANSGIAKNVAPNYKEQFTEWLENNNLSSSRARFIVNTLTGIVDYFIKDHIIQNYSTIFATVDVATIKGYRKALWGNELFTTTFEGLLPRISDAIRKYITFAESLWREDVAESSNVEQPPQIATPAEQGTFGTYQEQFYAYLINHNYTKSLAKRYITTITQTIDPYIRSHIDSGYTSILSTVDVKALERLKRGLKSRARFNGLTHNLLPRPLTVLSTYISFARSLQIKETVKTEVPKEASAPDKEEVNCFADYYKYQERFIDDLQRRGFHGAAIRKYVDAILYRLDPLARKLIDPNISSFFSTGDAEMVQAYYTQLSGTDEYKAINKETNNIADLALRKYLTFLQDSTKKKEPSPIVNVVAAKKEDTSAADLVSSFEFDIMQALTGYKLADIISFQYNASLRRFTVIEPKVRQDAVGQLKEVNKIINLMVKNNFSVSDELTERRKELSQIIQINERIDKFNRWFISSVSQRKKQGLRIEQINYSPKEGCHIQ